jgi:hypothetical protein
MAVGRWGPGAAECTAGGDRGGSRSPAPEPQGYGQMWSSFCAASASAMLTSVSATTIWIQ